MPSELDTVLIKLQLAEISASVGTAPPAHIVASLKDPEGGPPIRRDFVPDVDGRWPRQAMAAWLLEATERLYPGRLEKIDASRIK
jgi:hypothetical protein